MKKLTQIQLRQILDQQVEHKIKMAKCDTMTGDERRFNRPALKVVMMERPPVHTRLKMTPLQVITVESSAPQITTPAVSNGAPL